MLRLCFYFFMLFSLPAGAQIDSLKRELSYAKTDTAKISLYIQLAFESGDSTALHYAGEAVQLIINKLPQSAGAMQKKMYGYYSDAANAEGNYFEQQEIYDSSLYYYSNALMYARQAGDKLRESDQLIYAGLIYYYKNDIRRAIDYTAKSIEIKEQLKDETGLRRAYNNLAYFFKETGNINRCLELNFKALEIAERAGDDDDRGTTFNNIGQVYQENQKDYAKALDFYNKALLIYRRLNSKLDIALELNNISSVYAALGRYSDAVSYAQQSLTLRMEENNRYGIVQTLNNIGNDYLRMKKFDSARLYLVRADAANQSLQNKFLASYIHSNMSELYEYAGLLDSALYHGKCCFQISGSSGYPGEVARAAAMMSRLLEKKKDFKNALYYHQVADKMNDSIYNDNNKKAFLKIELEYEYQKKQAAAEEVFRQKQLHDNLVKWVLGILFLSAVVIGFILYNRYKIKKQLEQTQLRNKIASDLHDDVGATLSSIRMYSGVIQKQLREKNETGARKLLDKISENSMGVSK